MRCRRSNPLFQGVFGEFSHILHGSADASFSAILHSVTPDQPEPLSLTFLRPSGGFTSCMLLPYVINTFTRHCEQ